jgi:hypothetical protein
MDRLWGEAPEPVRMLQRRENLLALTGNQTLIPWSPNQWAWPCTVLRYLNAIEIKLTEFFVTTVNSVGIRGCKFTHTYF